MRPLTDEETKLFFEKMAQFIGRNIKHLIDRKDEPYCFRLHKDRIYYVSERLMRLATSVGRKELSHLGTCFAKVTKSGKCHLRITALEHLNQFARHKVFLKASNEMSFLYGNHVLASGVARMTEDCPQYAGVIVCASNGTPLGFGIAAQPTERAKDLDPTAIVVLHQCDVGEYLRGEEGVM